ncbi:MAG: aminodeoxychorismate lyase [Pseudomonadales bacterium]|jgi:4-amino-4-deoxychorismate lyase|nr:aminodeoxychorismate lyase [Pseudomonadales bacterium]
MNGGRLLINGEAGTSLPVSDRGLAFGDGLFETILVRGGRPILLQDHLARLGLGLIALRIPLEVNLLIADIEKLFSLYEPRDAVLKILCTRGQGGRGYRVSGELTPTRILSLHPLPPPLPEGGIKAFLCRQRLATPAALAGCKHLNRLEQVLASLEWPDDSFHEGLMLNAAGEAIEGTRTNLLLARNGRWLTPDLSLCGIAGVMRAQLLRRWGARLEVARLTLDEVLSAEELCFCNSVSGIMAVRSLLDNDGEEHHYQSGPLCAEAHAAFEELVT